MKRHENNSKRLGVKGFIITLVLLMIILFVTIVISASIGSSSLTFTDSLKIIVHRIPIIGNLISEETIEDIGSIYGIIVWNIRMPRICIAAMVGGALAIVGAAFQGIFKNPLADPHILGVSSGAAMGTTIAILSGITLNFLGLGTIGIFAFLGALVSVFLVYNVSRLGGEISTTNMLLTGTSISTFLSAIISLLMIFNRDQIEKVYMWTMGSFSSANWDKAKFLLFFLILGTIVIFLFAHILNIMMLGEEDAKCLGVDTDRARLIIIIAASLLVGASVSVSGIIGFVGLIIPHCIRLISGNDYKKLLPFSFFAGAIFLTVCDTVARTIAAPTEIPVGIITSLFGAPYFIFLIIRRRKNF